MQPCGAVNVREAAGVAGEYRKLLQILESRPPVARAHRVNMVDVAQQRSRAFGEPIRPQSPGDRVLETIPILEYVWGRTDGQLLNEARSMGRERVGTAVRRMGEMSCDPSRVRNGYVEAGRGEAGWCRVRAGSICCREA